MSNNYLDKKKKADSESAFPFFHKNSSFSVFLHKHPFKFIVLVIVCCLLLAFLAVILLTLIFS